MHDRDIPSVAPPVDALLRPRPWGVWPTIGFTLIVIMVTFVVGMVIGAVMGVVAGTQLEPEEVGEFIEGLDSNGLLISLYVLIASPVIIGWTLLFVVLRKGPTIAEYLAIRKVGWRPLMKWLLAVIALGMMSDLISFIIGRPIIPNYSIEMYETAYVVPFLWFALVLVSPISDETLYRGFLFAGLVESRLGAIGAVIIGAVVWSGLQIQYGPYTIATLFALAVLIGFARYKTQSLLPCIAMSALWNLYSMITLTIYMELYSTAGAV